MKKAKTDCAQLIPPNRLSKQDVGHWSLQRAISSWIWKITFKKERLR